MEVWNQNWLSLSLGYPTETPERKNTPGVTVQVSWKALELGDYEKRATLSLLSLVTGIYLVVPESHLTPFKSKI